MENCLVTKLKGSVNNNELSVLGAIKLHIVAPSNLHSDVAMQRQLAIRSSVLTTVEVVGSGNYLSKTTEGLSAPSHTVEIWPSGDYRTVYFAEGDYYVLIKSKYDVIDINNGPASTTAAPSLIRIKIGELAYVPLQTLILRNCTIDDAGLLNIDSNLSRLIISNVQGAATIDFSDSNSFTAITIINSDINIKNIDKISSCSSLQIDSVLDFDKSLSAIANINGITSLIISNCSLFTGNISSISGLTSLQTLNLSNTDVTGVFRTLAHITSLKDIAFFGVNISGTVEDYVSDSITAGRTSVDTANAIKITGFLSSLTFGGNSYSATYAHLTWSSASKIAIYAGNASLASCTTVYCKGYTQEEAKEAFSGKTIVRVDA